MHVTPADGSSKASDDGTLATLTFRWSHVADVLPSQIMWINIPSISILHWHPVSVAHVQLDDVHDSESTGTVTVHYKAYGMWTKVRVLCSSNVSSVTMQSVLLMSLLNNINDSESISTVTGCEGIWVDLLTQAM